MDERLIKSVDVKVQKKSGFDKSHMNLFTTKVGTLTPILCDEVIPNTTTSLKLNISASLPPLASDTFMRCDLKAEAFFVPARILVPQYENWLTGTKVANTPTGNSISEALLPVLQFQTDAPTKPGTLADYLGFRAFESGATQGSSPQVTMLPFIAYHTIYDEWYRNTLVQKSVFKETFTANNPGAHIGYYARNCKNIGLYTVTNFSANTFASNNVSAMTLNDGVLLTDLRQRNFGADYFTTATPSPQNGADQKLTMNLTDGGVNGESITGSTSFTIAALRAANSMQQFLERNNLAGNRFVDQLKAQYGATLNSGIAQRPVLLGSASFNVYSKGIAQTSTPGSGVTSGSTNNPMYSVGSEYGQAKCVGNDFIIKNFTAMEPGYIMVLVSLVPKVTYGTGIRRYLTHYIADGSQTDMANPILQNVGNQPIYAYELGSQAGYITNPASNPTVFGYTERYAEYKTCEDEVHGLLRDGQNLASFALQRTFSGNPTLGTEFITIPTDYLDQVSAVKGDISKYGVWIDSYLDYKQSMPLARYAVPSLQDPAYEHGVDVTIPRGGTQIRG